MQLRCMESCEALVEFRCATLVGSIGKALETVTFLDFLQPWESAAAVGNAVVNVVLCWIYDAKKIAIERFSIPGLCFKNLNHC